MKESSGPGKEVHPGCFRCSRTIKKGEKMFSLCISMEKQTGPRNLEIMESGSVSTLCFNCVSVLLSKAITDDEELMLPSRGEAPVDFDNINAEGTEQEIEQEAGEGQASGGARLRLRYSIEGFRLLLDCGDGASKATSQLFTWQQVVQMLISADPDMFGVLDEPLHHVFGKALSRPGYCVPGFNN